MTGADEWKEEDVPLVSPRSLSSGTFPSLRLLQRRPLARQAELDVGVHII